MLNQPHATTVEDLNITFEAGNIAQQANGAVTVRLGDTSLFVAATSAKSLRSDDQDFFPLTVDYREKFSAAGRFPGGFFKREGRPSEKEILTSRLCDRPLRPLFPKGFLFEVQITGLLLSTDIKNESDVLFVNAASAALAISDIPWDGPIGCVRIGRVNGKFVTNPTHEQQFHSDLDLIYVGSEKEMMMIEGSADNIAEDHFIEALEFAQKEVLKIIAAQKALVEKAGKEKRKFELFVANTEWLEFTRGLFGERLAKGVFQSEKSARDEAVAEIKAEAEIALKEKFGEEAYSKGQLNLIFESLQEELFRKEILNDQRRVDGRTPDELRKIECKAGVIPRVHGSALFQRGDTQNIVITTLGTSSDSQDSDGITGGSRSKSFILHYNFPPFSVGETGRFGSPGRREIGHGALAERSLLPVIPNDDDFLYTIRLVSEIMGSNGSTSMASVCGGCLALMDAGVPITDVVGGISVGLVTQKDESGKIEKHVILTDILGSEDHFGDMDFKICGTRSGITGFQLDLKIPGLPLNIAKEAIAQNREARLKIIDIMTEELPESRSEVGEFAPQIHQIEIDPEKIGALIGPGGKNIRRICEVSKAEIDIINDTGKVLIFAQNKDSLNRAVEEIDLACGQIELGKTYRGIVRNVRDFGAFIECLPGQEGFVHVSELADFRVSHPEDICQVGDEMWVKCIDVDERGRARLSRRVAIAEREAIARGEPIPEFDFSRPPRRDTRPPRSGGRKMGGRPPRPYGGGGGFRRY